MPKRGWAVELPRELQEASRHAALTAKLTVAAWIANAIKASLEPKKEKTR